MERKEVFSFRYHRDYSGSHNVFKVYTREPFNERRKSEYDKPELVEGEIVEHRLGGIDKKYDPRIYGIVKSYDGKAYAVSFNDSYNYDKIIVHEGLNSGDFVDTKVIPVSELSDDYELTPSREVTDGFSGPANRKYSPYDQCHNYISPDEPMYEVDEIYLIVMRLVAYFYSLQKLGIKQLVVTSDSEFLHQIEIHSFTLFNHTMYNNSKFDFKRVGVYCPDAKGIVLVRREVAAEYKRMGYEVLEFGTPKKDRQRGRKDRNDRHKIN